MAATKLFQNDTALKRRIVEKLKEFDAYIADELPAYILVMLDNKRQWSDISQELEVFLVESTEPFVEWLKKEIDPPKSEDNASMKKTDPKEQVVEKKVSTSPLDIRQSDHGRAIPQAPSTGAPRVEKARSRSPLKERTKNKERPSLQRYEAKGRQSDRAVSSSTHHSHSSHRKSSDHHRRSSGSSKHHHDDSSSSKHHHDDSSSSKHHHDDSRKKEKIEVESAPSTSTEKESSQTSLKESVDEDRIPIYAEQDEFRDENDRESDGSGSSREDARHLLTRSRKLTSKVVKVSRPKVSTNSLLLKRAMEGVHPSASSALAEKRKTVKTPPEAESERVEEDKEDLRTVIASHRSSKQQKSERKRDVRDRHVVMEEEDTLPAKRVKQALLFEEEGEIEHRVEAASTSKEKPVKRPRLVMTETGLRTYKSLVKSGEIVDADLLVAQEEDDLQEGVLELPQRQEEEVVSPHPLERCKFWPQCKNGDRCSFHHPTTPCNMFPKCRFGAKCLFIHPQCKFDARCTRPNCPYLHTAPKQRHPTSPFSMFMQSAAIPIPSPIPYSGRGRGADKPRPHLDRSAFVWKPGNTNKPTHISERMFATRGKSTAMPVSSNT